MSDTTNVQVIIHSCPEDQRDAVFGILENHQLNEDWGTRAPTAPLTIGVVYGSNFGSGDESEFIADEIIEAAPGASFITWTDPAYEWLGSGVMYTPELGRFGYESNADGQPVFTQDQVLTALISGDVPRALGVPWTNALR